MLEESRPLLESINNADIDNEDNIKKGVFATIHYYLKQPTLLDWFVVVVIVGAIIGTIIFML